MDINSESYLQGPAQIVVRTRVNLGYKTYYYRFSNYDVCAGFDDVFIPGIMYM